ncbi:MAG: DUF1320 domain-containing protein [Bacteroidales bacterium]|nr:DUF1320 domain-containing protein [Bacteroidales bacterium]
MFIERDELRTAMKASTMGNLQADDVAIDQAILMAIQEATSYLNGKYDCTKIFNARGTDRNPLVLEHCKSMAIWYLLRISNANYLFDKAKIYYDNAISWLKLVAGVGESGKTIAPDLPIKQSDDGTAISKLRLTSNPKFTHSF